MRSDVAIIIPAYNEASIIKKVLQEVLAHYSYVVCVDDGSSDLTSAEIAKTKAYLVRHPINLGQGAALQTGIEAALANPDIVYFVTFDADGQHRLADAAKMLDTIKNGSYDIVLGSRFLSGQTKLPKIKKAVLKMAIQFSNLSSGVKLTDAHNGLRVFNRKVAETLQITMPDMAHASEIVNKIRQRGYSYTEVPVTIDYTKYSMQKGQSVFNAINILFDLLLAGGRKR